MEQPLARILRNSESHILRHHHGFVEWELPIAGINFGGCDMRKPILARELWAFMRVRKKWWLLPIVVVMLTVGALLVVAQGSVLAPFIYTIF